MRKLCVFTKYWLLNKTGLALSYQFAPRLVERLCTRAAMGTTWQDLAAQTRLVAPSADLAQAEPPPEATPRPRKVSHLP